MSGQILSTDNDVAMLENALQSIGQLTAKIDSESTDTTELESLYRDFTDRTAAIRNALVIGRLMAKSSAQHWNDMEVALSRNYLARLATAAIERATRESQTGPSFAIEHIKYLIAMTRDQNSSPCQEVNPDHVAFLCKARVNCSETVLDLSFTFSLYVTCASGVSVFKIGHGLQIFDLPLSASDSVEPTQLNLTQTLQKCLNDSVSPALLPLMQLTSLGIPQATCLTAFTTPTTLNLLATYQDVFTVNPTLNPKDPQVPTYYRQQLREALKHHRAPTAPELPTIPTVPWQRDATVKIRTSVVAQTIYKFIFDAIKGTDGFQGLSGPTIFPVPDPYSHVGGSLYFTAHFSYSVFLADFDYYSQMRIDLVPDTQLLCRITREVYDGWGVYDWGIQVHTHWITEDHPLPIGSATYVDPALTTDALYLHLQL